MKCRKSWDCPRRRSKATVAGTPTRLRQTKRHRDGPLNRRIEVELWYDDPLQDYLTPQLCPDDVDETVTRIYDPPWGSIPPPRVENGQRSFARLRGSLRHALTDISDRTNARPAVIGYTKNEQLDRRTASVYGDNIGLSAAPARRAMDILLQTRCCRALRPSTKDAATSSPTTS